MSYLLISDCRFVCKYRASVLPPEIPCLLCNQFQAQEGMPTRMGMAVAGNMRNVCLLSLLAFYQLGLSRFSTKWNRCSRYLPLPAVQPLSPLAIQSAIGSSEVQFTLERERCLSPCPGACIPRSYLVHFCLSSYLHRRQVPVCLRRRFRDYFGGGDKMISRILASEGNRERYRERGDVAARWG